MIRALLADLSRVNDIEPLCLRSPRLPLPLPVPVYAYAGEEDFDEALRLCDAAWLIAPETNGCLERLASQVLRRERSLLNCTPEAIRVAADKRETARCLAAVGIPVVPCYATLKAVPADVEFVVVKPNDGAGCIDTEVLRRDDASHREAGGTVYQPYVPGDARSLSVLCTAVGAELLCVNRQILERRGRALEFLGVDVDAMGDPAGEYAELARRIWHALPGLRGYVGVDFVQTDNGPVVIEINPRLTSAYVGMSRKLGCNVAGRIIEHMRAGLLGALA